MELDKRILQTLELSLSGFKKERWSDTEYEVEATNVNDLTVFLSFAEDGTVMLFMLSEEDIPATNNKEEERNDAT